MQLKYDKLFSLKIKHSYYTSEVSDYEPTWGVSRDFKIIPFNSTQELLETYSLKANSQSGELFVVCKKKLDSIPDTPIDQNIVLRFFYK
ncbi:MAG: hypothetical protein HC892_22240 [Saprospiraceae bacterium]|nr:hypothetical protein [Saprospiraceae bacterium]